MSADELGRILDELGRRLGPAGEHVFALAVRQVYIDGAMSMLAAAVSLAVGWQALRTTRRFRANAWAKWNAKPTNYPSIDGHPVEDITVALPSLLGYAVVLLAVLAAIGFTSTALTNLLNPEYVAIRDILGAVKR
jgi:hypothetical protein